MRYLKQFVDAIICPICLIVFLCGEVDEDREYGFEGLK